jgi:hypothetical protein
VKYIDLLRRQGIDKNTWCGISSLSAVDSSSTRKELVVPKKSPVRVAFLTNDAFRREDAFKAGALKKRALRRIMNHSRTFCIEDSTNPDVIFTIYRLPGSKSWCLRRRVEHV